ncbi:hypothetical protein F4819DRAFT_464992 [Hypoxylon fuscum]|nr:hypothetical protein F4819DRAFT_464992 [Hypoxylon fuscum]
MAHENTEYLNDEDLISLYFDLEAASLPSSDNFSSLGGFKDEDIPGFIPIEMGKDNRNRLQFEQEYAEENFSGGFGCYVWPWSSEVMITGYQGSPVEEIDETLDIKQKNKSRHADNMSRDAKYEYILPSKLAGIDWSEVSRDIWKRPS